MFTVLLFHILVILISLVMLFLILAVLKGIVILMHDIWDGSFLLRSNLDDDDEEELYW